MRDVRPANVMSITLTAEQRQAREALAGSHKSEVRMQERAKIVPLAADGLGSCAIAGEVHAGHGVEVACAQRMRPHGGPE